ncbi:hypothetical protein BAXH7_02839 [Bacillus amyloliquefaciens XH7]|nr:hypothetical protein BAXH7_02839 [Bacillus amyloliquefaciens XH7]KYC95274.1 hypothetical protein B425_2110 [Bacillus amyloliquefaciens]QBG57277.1 hypothetical protein D2M30_2949 [Bacillus amyloliquefaciens]
MFKCINTRQETQERMTRTAKKAAGQMPDGFFQARSQELLFDSNC